MTARLARLLADNRRVQGRRFEVRRGLQASAAENSAEVLLYDTIVDDEAQAEWWGGIAPAPFVRELRGLDAEVIHLRINSPGGSVFGARAMEAALRQHPARVVVHIDGLAASAATVVAMAGDEVLMGEGSMFMIHRAWTLAMGNEAELRDTAAMLAKVDATIARTYAARTGQSVDDIFDLMSAETWFDSSEAVANGFADRVEEPVKAAGAAWNLQALRAQATAKDSTAARPIDFTRYLRV